MHRFQRPSSIGINELEETIDSLIVLVHSRITKKEVFILLVYFSWLARKETGVQARWCTNKSWTQRGTSKYVPLFYAEPFHYTTHFFSANKAGTLINCCYCSYLCKKMLGLYC
ncbi:Hypothetical protein P9211_14881 [Prochlorococcus marinus str. MIT 9211]|uniref:Uncharacterized protein n=1 Tax=Prochlorococcus marinus (strain MIT 9211) TaxID=93059 RepID=A9BC57_PROM4|nr:Hypothetical protein P9211_14881 [Prochlorococcus marinus str. MIT 9211]